MQPATIEDLKKVIALCSLPNLHLQWILEHSEFNEYEDGTLLTRMGDPADFMWILLEGRLSYYMDVNGTMVYYLTFENDRLTGGITGMMPRSRMKVFAGSWYSVGKVRMLLLHKKYFVELEQLNPDFISLLTGYMTERAKTFATIQLQYEKVSALGKLSAGIAHELNNPAAAINRTSSELTKKVKSNYELTKKLLQYNISPQHLQDIINRVERIEKDADPKIKLTALQRMEKEDEITEWLEKNNFSENRQAAETFSDAGFSIDDFEHIRNHISSDSFIQILYWLENLLSSQRILKDLEDASSRISNLVGAIKSHVQMDRTNDMQQTNIHNDIENTITLLGYKLRVKNITVAKNFSENMPQVEAYIGELNQVWTNLIDNAIYALEENGELTITTSCDEKNITVRIIDNGEGIPDEIVSRIFDPFFTTKKVGQGTGIGLDIASRIIKRHNGEIKVNSIKGRTEFTVYIPIIRS